MVRYDSARRPSAGWALERRIRRLLYPGRSIEDFGMVTCQRQSPRGDASRAENSKQKLTLVQGLSRSKQAGGGEVGGFFLGRDG